MLEQILSKHRPHPQWLAACQKVECKTATSVYMIQGCQSSTLLNISSEKCVPCYWKDNLSE